jgi:hypothetical protein
MNIGVALLMLTLCARLGLVVSTIPWPLYIVDRAPLSIVEEARWASVPVWTRMEKRIYLTSTGVRTPDRPAHRKSLYRLCQPTALDSCYDQHFTGTYLLLQVSSNIRTSTRQSGEVYSLKMLLPSYQTTFQETVAFKVGVEKMSVLI